MEILIMALNLYLISLKKFKSKRIGLHAARDKGKQKRYLGINIRGINTHSIEMKNRKST